MVLPAVKKSVFSLLHGEQWIGFRVRASAHVLLPNNNSIAENNSSNSNSNNTINTGSYNGGDAEDASKSVCDSSFPDSSTSISTRSRSNDYDDFSDSENNCAKCVGTIVKFSPALNMHLIVYDEPLLQSKWVTCNSESIELLLGNEEDVSRVGLSPIGNNAAGTVEYSTATAVMLSNESINISSSDFNIIGNCSTGSGSKCNMCDVGFDNNSKSFQCTKCNELYHRYCMPYKFENI